MNREGLHYRVNDAAKKLTDSLTEVVSCLERFRMGGIEQVKAIRLMNESLDKLIKAVISLDERMESLEKNLVKSS